MLSSLVYTDRGVFAYESRHEEYSTGAHSEFQLQFLPPSAPVESGCQAQASSGSDFPLRLVTSLPILPSKNGSKFRNNRQGWMLRCSSEVQLYRGSGDLQGLPLGVSGVCVCVYMHLWVCGYHWHECPGPPHHAQVSPTQHGIHMADTLLPPERLVDGQICHYWTQGIHLPLKVRAPGPSWEEPSISGVRQSLQPPQPYIEWLLHRWVCDTSPSQLAWRKRTLSPCCQAARGGEWWAVPGLQRGQSNLEETPIQQAWAKLRCAPGRDYLNTLIQSDLKVVSPVIFNYVNP